MHDSTLSYLSHLTDLTASERYKPKWANLDTFWYLDIYLQKYIQIAIYRENKITDIRALC